MWEALYRRHYPELLRYAAAACQNSMEAEDVAQEVFLKAMQSADVFQDLGPSQQRAWLFRSLKNLMCDRYRRAQLEAAFLENQPMDAAGDDPEMEAAENRMLMAQLSQQDRLLFHLRYEEGYNASELAAMFHMPPGTIRARLSRCRSLLKTMLKTGGTENA